MTAQQAAETTANHGGDWFCKNCGQENAPDVGHCSRCGFAKDYDPDAAPEIDFSEMQETIQQQSEQRMSRLTLITRIATLVVNALLLIVVLAIGFKMLASWPFTSQYEQNALELADAVLAMQASLDQGITKGQYDELLVNVSVQATKLSTLYGQRSERQLSSYQKLVQAAEYYEIAHDAWENQLIKENPGGRIPADAPSNEASEDVKKYWDTASSNILLALGDMQ